MFLDPFDPADDNRDADFDEIKDVVEDKNHDWGTDYGALPGFAYALNMGPCPGGCVNPGLTAGESDWLRADTDRDALCDGPLAAAGSHVVAGFWSAPAGTEVLIAGGKMWLDLSGDGVNFGDPYICGKGEDLAGFGTIAGDTNPDRFWDALLGEVWAETDALNPDTDGDGLCDGSNNNAFEPSTLWPLPCAWGEDLNDNAVAAERGASETDPLDADTDGDAVGDFAESTPWGANCMDPLDADTDGDGLLDGFREDPATRPRSSSARRSLVRSCTASMAGRGSGAPTVCMTASMPPATRWVTTSPAKT